MRRPVWGLSLVYVIALRDGRPPAPVVSAGTKNISNDPKLVISVVRRTSLLSLVFPFLSVRRYARVWKYLSSFLSKSRILVYTEENRRLKLELSAKE